MAQRAADVAAEGARLAAEAKHAGSMVTKAALSAAAEAAKASGCELQAREAEVSFKLLGLWERLFG